MTEKKHDSVNNSSLKSQHKDSMHTHLAFINQE